ncbi:GGDEF domain-containing protein [Vibrio intestinalis]|uniref:GGDEF domain-containing protein n=1 Tax=Vibrio intestinalis TaxID=2933291 RepID=UPI0021A7F90D|nr:GGDEF domain-containing protein [Vibrio intestinalis]
MGNCPAGLVAYCNPQQWIKVKFGLRMVLQYTKMSPSSATIEVRTLLLMLIVVFAINTPLGIIKREKIEAYEQQLKVASETFQLRKDMVESYLSLANSTIAKHYFSDPEPFNDLIYHLLNEQSLISSISIIPRYANANKYGLLLSSYLQLEPNENQLSNQTFFWPDEAIFTEVTPIYDDNVHLGYLIIEGHASEFANSFRQDTLMLDLAGFVYSSSYDGISQLASLPEQYTIITEQLSRSQRTAGVLDIGDHTVVYRHSVTMNGQQSYLIKLVRNDQLIPTYVYLLMVLTVATIGISYFLYRTRKDKQELTKMTYTDELSGLHNRHYLNKVNKQSLKPNKYYLAVFDIDHFKRVNDKYGHDIGDQVIRRVAQAIKRRIRISDFAFRMGGEEFLVVVKTDCVEVASQIFERIRLDVAEMESAPKVTISGGASRLVSGLGQSIKQADSMLYQAKDQGRNQICLEGLEV